MNEDDTSYEVFDRETPYAAPEGGPKNFRISSTLNTTNKKMNNLCFRNFQWTTTAINVSSIKNSPALQLAYSVKQQPHIWLMLYLQHLSEQQ